MGDFYMADVDKIVEFVQLKLAEQREQIALAIESEIVDSCGHQECGCNARAAVFPVAAAIVRGYR